MLILASFVSAEYCYQETANVSTACGGLATGKYSVNHLGANDLVFVNYTKPSNVTGAIWQVKHGNLTKTYNITIPESCWNNLTDRIQFRLQASVEIDLPQDLSYSEGMCFNGTWIGITNRSTDYIHRTSFPNGSPTSSALPLYDGDWSTGSFYYTSNWYNITTSIHTIPVFYEEGIFWDIPPTYLDNCDNYTNIVANFTLHQEVLPSNTLKGDISINLNFTDINTSYNYSFTNLNSDSIAFCSPDNRIHILDVYLQSISS